MNRVYIVASGDETLWRSSYWIALLEAAVLHGYATPEQVERFITNGLLVEVYATAERTVEVQILSLLGPQLSSALDADARDGLARPSGSPYSAHGTGGPVHSWWWRFDLPEGVETARITWRIDARGAFEMLGLKGDELAGSTGVELPIDVDGVMLLKRWRPLER